MLHRGWHWPDRKSTRLNSSHLVISYAVFCLKKKSAGVKSGMKLEDVVVPPYLPDTPEVRGDMLDYYFAVQRFDRDVGEVLQLLEASGRPDNTLVVISGDNGWPFPRGKANLYDAGTRQPLALRWPAQFKGG